MDAPKQTIIEKCVSYFFYVLLPVLLGNVVSWSHSVVAGKTISKRARIAMAIGSLAMAAAVHHAAEGWRFEWVLMWFLGIFSKQLLEFLYVEFWDMAKAYLKSMFKTWAQETLKIVKKK